MSSELQELSLTDICSDVSYGYTESATDEPVGPKFLRITDIQGGIFDWDTVPYCPATDANVIKYRLEIGDIVVARTGNSTGENAQINKEPPSSVFASYLIRFRPDAKQVNPFFIGYQLRSDRFRQHVLAVRGGSAQPGANAKQLGAFPIRLIPRHLQDSAVEILCSIDDRIALMRETNATLEAIAQAMFKSWFVDFDPVHAKQQGRPPEGMSETTAALFPDSFEETELGLVPRGWAVGSIGKVAEVIDCLHAKKPELLESGSPYLQLNNIRDDGLLDTANLAFVSDADYTKWISRIEVSGGDCVITNVGRVGAVAQIPESFRAAMGRNMTAIRMRKEWPYPTYLVELLQSPWMETEIQRRTDIGTILNALNVKNIPLLRCVLADHNLLKEFEDTARPLRAAMEANLERANNLATLRDTLLPRLISGQLRLSDLEGAVQ